MLGQNLVQWQRKFTKMLYCILNLLKLWKISGFEFSSVKTQTPKTTTTKISLSHNSQYEFHYACSLNL